MAAHEHGRLAENVLGLWDGIILGFASAAPGVSIVGVLGGLAGASGYGALLALLAGFLPLVCIAMAFYHLNRWRADVGISYAWIGRILSPVVGAFVGILIIIAFVVSNSFAIIPAATNFLTIFSTSASSSKVLVTIVGTIILALISGLVILGIQLAARFQWVITTIEMVVMSVFAILALRHGLAHRSTGGTAPHLSWLTLHSAGGWSGLVAGLLISVFWYSGWETSVVVNEETRQARRNPGLAGIGSLIAVLVASLILGALFLSAVTPDTMSNNSAWITDLGFQLAGKPWGYLLIVAIMLGYLGGIETTIITFGNVAYSMGRDGVLAGRFASLSDRTRMPTFAIVVFSIPSLLVFLVQVWASGGTLANIASDLASSLGLMFVIYYALTGLAAAWMLRGIARTNVTVAITGVLAPLAGAIALVAIGVKTWTEPSTTTPIKVTFLVAVAISIAVVIVSKLRGTTDFWASRESRAMTEADLADTAA